MNENKAQNANEAVNKAVLSIDEITPYIDSFIGKLKEAKSLTNGIKYRVVGSGKLPANNTLVKHTVHTDAETGATGIKWPGIDGVFYDRRNARRYMNTTQEVVRVAIKTGLLYEMDIDGIPGIPEAALTAFMRFATIKNTTPPEVVQACKSE